jgi:GntR family transcriptional regulator
VSEGPKYQDIKGRIEDMIRRGEFPPGSKLPSEPEMVTMFHVSRGTVRRALEELERHAIISRRSGSGTFVVREPKEARVVPFREQIRRAGMEPKTVVRCKERIMASEAAGRVCEAFYLDPEKAAVTPVYCVDRLRCGDDQPLARQTIYLLAADYEPDLLERADFEGSVFRIYADHYRYVGWADEIIRARPPTPDEIELLQMQDLPLQERFVYERNRITYDQENRPLEVLVSIDRGDFFRAYSYRIVEGESPLERGVEGHDA